MLQHIYKIIKEYYNMTKKQEQPRRRSLSDRLDAELANAESIPVAGINTTENQQPTPPVTPQSEYTAEEQGGAGHSDERPATEQPTGIAAEKPCFLTVAIPESIKRIVDIKVRYDSKELPQYNQTIKHVGRRWFLRGLLAEGLITQEQFDEAAALHSEYGWEKDKVAAKRNRK